MTNGRHTFLHDGFNAVLRRTSNPDTDMLAKSRLRYVMADPKLVDLSYAGRLRDGHPSHSAIAEARVGASVQLRCEGEKWLILDASNRILGRMSRSFRTPQGCKFMRGEIAAILNWTKDDSDEAFHSTLTRSAWEVVLPELVFETGP